MKETCSTELVLQLFCFMEEIEHAPEHVLRVEISQHVWPLYVHTFPSSLQQNIHTIFFGCFSMEIRTFILDCGTMELAGHSLQNGESSVCT